MYNFKLTLTLSLNLKSLFAFLFLFSSLHFYSQNKDTIKTPILAKDMRVDFPYSEPFVLKNTIDWTGISVEVWEFIVKENNIKYSVVP